MNWWTRRQFLMAPDGANGAVGAGSGGGGGGGLAAIADDHTMDTVFERLNLPKELRGDKPKVKEETARGRGTTASAEEAVAEEETATEETAAGTEAGTEEQTEETTEEQPGEEQTEETTEETAAEEPTVETVTAELETIRTEKADLETRVAQLEKDLESASDTPVAVAPIHPIFLEDDPAKVEKMENEYAAFEEWALRNWDGTEEIKDEKTDKVLQPAYPKEAIRARYAELKQIRERMVPAAAQVREARRINTEFARKTYPALFNPKSTDYAIAQNILRRAPGLKAVLPNIYTVIGDALEGEKLRTAREKKAAEAARSRSRGTAGAAGPAAGGTPKGKPSAGKTGAGVGRTAATNKGNGNNVPSAKKFMEMGGTRNALVDMIRNTNIPTVQRGN